MKSWIVTIFYLGITIAAGQDDRIYNFVGKYCLDCHDDSVQKGDRNFELFETPLKSEADLITAKEIIDQLTLQEMPPKKADQPSEDERLAVIRDLREAMSETRGKIESTGGRTVIRRLSNREYENTIETLFGRQVETLGLTADFPKDHTSHHLDNIGETLVTSGFLLDQYFQAANRLVELRLAKEDIPVKEWHFDGHFVQYEELSGPHRAAFKFRYLNLYEQPDTDTRQGGYGHIENFLSGVPVSGNYEIKVLAQALHRDTHYDPKIFRIDFSEPFQLGIVPGDVTKGHIHYPQSIEPLLGKTIVPDDKPELLTFTVWLEKGQTPRFIFPNGPYESRASVIEINKRYKDEFKGEISRSGVSRTHILREGALPHIRISDIKIKGPLPEPDGTREEIAVFGKGGFNPEKAIPQLESFATKAYRRPLAQKDKDLIRSLFNKRIKEGADKKRAAIDTVKMILCSPSFLYLSEITDGDKNEKLTAYDLASRLSYTLWASPPDKQLLESAKSKAILKDNILREQVKRLLNDKEKSAAFVEGFLDSWLNLRELGNQPPPRRSARDYYAEALPVSMKEEVNLFFRNLIDTNGPVTDLLDSNYTFVDKKLAKLYNLPEKDSLRLADGFQKVTLKERNESERGGVLGMAAVLTVSANGVETSPVTRGVWVSENILGIQPPPPPDEVPEIESDVRGASTIREKLAKHSADKTCSECHRKIDPLGFGLETFDPIGRWRTHYTSGKTKLKIDSSGEFSSGDKYKDFAAFRQFLTEHRSNTFTKNLISKLLSYSTGRHMEIGDYHEIEEIYQKVVEEKHGLQTLITEALCSEIFRSR